MLPFGKVVVAMKRYQNKNQQIEDSRYFTVFEINRIISELLDFKVKKHFKMYEYVVRIVHNSSSLPQLLPLAPPPAQVLYIKSLNGTVFFLLVCGEVSCGGSCAEFLCATPFSSFECSF